MEEPVTNSEALTAKAVIENDPVLAGLRVVKSPGVFTFRDLMYAGPQRREIEGQYDLCAEIDGVLQPPAFRRVTKNWKARQPAEILEAIGFDEFSQAWGFRHTETELLKENTRSKTPSITGVKLLFEADLEERYTNNLGAHSVMISITLHWSGITSDKVRVWLLDRWCTNGMTSRRGLYSVSVNHSKLLKNYVDKNKIYAAIEEHLKWKEELASIPLERTLGAELVRLIEGDRACIKGYLSPPAEGAPVGAESHHGTKQYSFDAGVDALLEAASLGVDPSSYHSPKHLPPQVGEVSNSNRIITKVPPRVPELLLEDGNSWVEFPTPPPHISTRRLNQIAGAMVAERARPSDTGLGWTALDLANNLTRMFAQGDKVLPPALERAFNSRCAELQNMN